MSRIAFVDHRNAHATQKIGMRVGMNVITATIAGAGQFEGDFFAVEPGVR